MMYVDLDTLCENEIPGDDNEIRSCCGTAIDTIRVNGYWLKVCADCRKLYR